MNRGMFLKMIISFLFMPVFLSANNSIVIRDSVSTGIDSIKRLAVKDFMYADTKRATLDGNLPLIESDINAYYLGGFVAAYTTWFIIQHDLQMQTIWKERGDFHFLEDGEYALYSDKAGHFYGCYFTSYMMRECLVMTGLSWDWSNAVGTALGLGYSTYVEVLDGFATRWGFSPSDFYADVAGALLFYGQNYVPVLQNFTPKFTYIPADLHGQHKRCPADAMIDDYSSHTLWLSVNVHNMLPENMKDYWPSWIELSFGYAVRNLCSPGDCACTDGYAEKHYINDGNDIVYGDQKFIISLDYNLVKMLPDGPPVWNWFKQSLNYLKFPSPAVEFGDKTRFYLLYPFEIKF